MSDAPFTLLRVKFDWRSKEPSPRSVLEEEEIIPEPPASDGPWTAGVDYLLRKEGDYQRWGELALRTPRTARPPQIVESENKLTPLHELHQLATPDSIMWCLPFKWSHDKNAKREITNLSRAGTISIRGSQGDETWSLTVRQCDTDFGVEFPDDVRDTLRELLELDWQQSLTGDLAVQAELAAEGHMEKVVSAARKLVQSIRAVTAHPRLRLRRAKGTGGSNAKPRLPEALRSLAQGRQPHQLPTWEVRPTANTPANAYVCHIALTAARWVRLRVDTDSAEAHQVKLAQEQEARDREPRKVADIQCKIESEIQRLERDWDRRLAALGQPNERFELEFTIGLGVTVYAGDRLYPNNTSSTNHFRIWYIDTSSDEPPVATYFRAPNDLIDLLCHGGGGKTTVKAHIKCNLGPEMVDTKQQTYRKILTYHPVRLENELIASRRGWLKQLHQPGFLNRFTNYNQRPVVRRPASDRCRMALQSIEEEFTLLAKSLTDVGVRPSVVAPTSTLAGDQRYGEVDRRYAQLRRTLRTWAATDEDQNRRQRLGQGVVHLSQRAQRSQLLYESYVGAAILSTLSNCRWVNLTGWAEQFASTFAGNGNNPVRIEGHLEFEDQGEPCQWRLVFWREASVDPKSQALALGPRKGWKRPDYVVELIETNGTRHQIVFDAKYLRDSGDDHTIAKALYHIAVWPELHREVTALSGSPIPNAPPHEGPTIGHDIKSEEDVKNYSHKGSRGVVVLHPNLGCAPVSETPQSWAAHSYYGGTTVWAWQRRLPRSSETGKYRDAVSACSHRAGPAIQFAAVALRPNHPGDLRRLLEHWLLERLLHRCSSTSKQRPEERAPLTISLSCPTCLGGRLQEIVVSGRMEHVLRCDGNDCDAISITHCRHCGGAPLIKRKSAFDMIHDAMDANPQIDFTNARCPWCENYLWEPKGSGRPVF